MSERKWPHNLTRADLTAINQASAGDEKEAISQYQTLIDRRADSSKDSIDRLLNFDPIDYIRQKIGRGEFSKRKFSVLDMGGGDGSFRDQLLDEFGDKIEVLTTGVSKKLIRRQRGEPVPKGVAKWRSILELSHESKEKPGSPSEEFDLIVNTWGEWPWLLLTGKEHPELGVNGQQMGLNILNMVAAKLRAGGVAVIAPVSDVWKNYEDLMLKGWRQEHPEMKLEFLDNGRQANYIIIKMEKINPNK